MENSEQIKTYAKYTGIGIGAFLILSTLKGSFYTIDQTERGALLTNGAFTDTVKPGLHFKLPFIQSVTSVDVLTHNISFKDMESYSQDQQPARIRVSVTYHVSPDRIEDMYSRFTGDRERAIERLVSPHVFANVKNVFGGFTASRAITERAKLNANATDAVMQAIVYDPVIVIESVQIEDITFSPDYIKNVEARMAAEVKVQQSEQELAQEKIKANIAVTQAQGRANSVKAEAEAQALKIRAVGEAEAFAIETKGKALGNNPKLIEYTAVERWGGVLPQTMVPGASVPFINVK